MGLIGADGGRIRTDCDSESFTERVVSLAVCGFAAHSTDCVLNNRVYTITPRHR